MEFMVKSKQLSREVWEERDYKMIKPSNLSKEDFEKIAKVFVGWDDDAEMEIKFTYIFNDTEVFVSVRERIE